MNDLPFFESEEAIPMALGSLVLEGLEVYENEDLGIRLSYRREQTVADIYLYDLGIDDIPDDIHSERVRGFFEEARRQVVEAAECGVVVELECVAAEYLYLSDDATKPMFLWAAYRYRQVEGEGEGAAGEEQGAEGAAVVSHVLLRTDGGYINKIRYTFPMATDSGQEREMVKFLLDWHEAIPREGFPEV